jgi:membrane-associated protein
MEFLHEIKDFLNPKFLIDYLLALLGGYAYFGLWFIVFAETGLAVGFFLPGDSLLVVSGLFAAAGKLNVALVLLAFFPGFGHRRQYRLLDRKVDGQDALQP